MDVLTKIAACTEYGKENRETPYPAEMKGEDGVDELVGQAIASGIDARTILAEALMKGMQRVGDKFSRNEVFIPDLLVAANAMKVGLERLKPYFKKDKNPYHGVLVLGTVEGDLHDIGKSIVKIIMEAHGWKVIDLGVNIATKRFMKEIKRNPGCAVGLSALLSTAVRSMEQTVRAIKEKKPGRVVLIGGAAPNEELCKKMGADFYTQDPQQAVEYLNRNGRG